MINWRTTITGVVSTIAISLGLLNQDPVFRQILSDLGLARIVIFIALATLVFGSINAALQRDSAVSDQQAGLRREVKESAKIGDPTVSEVKSIATAPVTDTSSTISIDDHAKP